LIPTYAVVPSYGRECVKTCLDSLVDQVDLIFLVQTRAFAIRSHPKLACLPWDPARELNISEWWNCGIKAAAMTADGRAEWNVLVVNDDIIAPPHLTAALSKAMRATTAVLAYPPHPSRGDRAAGWCFMLRGESGIRADPQFRWWFGDDDLHLRAAAQGGSLPVEGCEVTHLHPGGHDYQMRERIALDYQMFREKWTAES
jgi:hypothetical protein